MFWLTLIAVAAVVVVLGVWAWRSSGRSTKPAPPATDRARRQGEALRDHGPTNVPTNPGGM